MKRYNRVLLLIISICFITFAFAEELQCCSDKTVYAVQKERPVVRVTDTKRAQEISQTSRARGVYGGDMIRPKGKKNSSVASMTKSTLLALFHVTTATLVHLFLY
ncbi:hypothetical protein CARUB_v10006091mg [Capsella rubella]|uniref:Uncharacterized protein n=1 Tax=Capsella rubella TaxID=81985 RepID=R0F760_9BRAS|nr:hypothetical protein CARUB_v10006091mg [Capsella rubella]